ncbi:MULTISPECIES: flagellar biosynthesis protein FlhB [unclassified Idiomarina]|jgi:flagellar biosynthetic protein FlhB|uniref:flagellar biosynthesis protein FlhB n=1 Tax=unclassified Idiomarina TaxID=2614829 RepID=UPI0008F95B26|nr:MULTISPECIES: flagellar biosynthesis protein FlhB [unclassified Idiomarina]MAD53745.1 flagellar biosynthesis protein FlhB [Idiomarinaceae bacterium]MEC7642632.1 flagellar biosynthesis protein FlhB [Pseudomonadota bacterium]NQZ05466.1 flagellar biosynthesis protein FlhB [Idiomarina sp.]OIM97854.1 flagellar biosynthesis protein FlhB [Idiomarina sp. MD25a]|tara:strand:+ start:1988 stop:3115 length:1128 start_codon:yes stop_codon:yes gene_type:complete
MAETDQERTEEPTEKRKREAREKGQVARSKEMGTAFVLVSAAVAFFWFGESLYSGARSLFRDMFTLERRQAFDTTQIYKALAIGFEHIIWPVIIIFAFITVFTFLGNSWLGGINFSWKAMAPKFSRMNPLNGFKRMFGTQALIELVKGIAKFAVVAVSAFLLLSWQFENILQISMGQMPNMIENALDILMWMFLLICCSMFLIVVIDAPFQLWKHNKDLRMTKQEVKDEHKDSEGSPEVKGRIRRLQMEMANRRMMQEVPKADVVVTNPTHFAVAIKYEENGSQAPILLAKGTDETAAKIREIALEYDVPLVASPALARSIYHTTELEAEIPRGLFVAVAQVLAYVYQLKMFKQGQAKRPKKPNTDGPIPEDLRH